MELNMKRKRRWEDTEREKEKNEFIFLINIYRNASTIVHQGGIGYCYLCISSYYYYYHIYIYLSLSNLLLFFAAISNFIDLSTFFFALYKYIYSLNVRFIFILLSYSNCLKLFYSWQFVTLKKYTQKFW